MFERQLMPRASHALQIDLCFRDAARELIDAVAARLASNFSGERFDSFGQSWIRKNR